MKSFDGGFFPPLRKRIAKSEWEVVANCVQHRFGKEGRQCQVALSGGQGTELAKVARS